MRYNVYENTLNGVTYQYWDEWSISWHRCGFGYEKFWYDGEYKTWWFGIGSLNSYGNDNHREMRTKNH